MVQVAGEGVVRRTRKRRQARSFDDKTVLNRVIDFVESGRQSRSEDMQRRLQRYAKYRQWTEGKSWPWEDSSDSAIPDLMTESLRTQDTLHNAVMSGRPPVVSEALRKDNQPQQDKIDQLLDFQFFTEQEGEKILEEVIEAFVNDGVFTAFIPWVKEQRKTVDTRVFDPVPLNQLPIEHFRALLEQEFPKARTVQKDDDGWDWEVLVDDEKERKKVKFYTRKDESVEMVTNETVTVYDGPRVIVKEYAEVIHPPRSANLQMPGPSNPGGAPHVILVDHPTIDEIKRLQRSGFYDLVTKKDLDDKLDNIVRSTTGEEQKEQVDAMQGETQTRLHDEVSHRTLTRYTCFDTFDMDGDGLDEDVIFWVLAEPKLLLKAKHLTEMYPSNPPRRPFAEASFLPVKGRRQGISLLEITEGLHDLRKTLFDMMVDSGTLSATPFGFFRPSSAMKPEVMRLSPGDMYPLNDPKNDVSFPQMQGQDQSLTLNLLGILQQFEERLTLQGDLQGGRVPAGKASALRTVGGIQTILAQGEARPERILRRFFMGLTEIFRQMHELNQKFLPDKKIIRITGLLKNHEDPYLEIERASEIRGRFKFSFNANVLNASREAKLQGLQAMMGVYVSELAIQTGISTPETIYRLFRDFGQATGQNQDRYLNEPSPDVNKIRMTWQEVVSQIMEGAIPDVIPFEGAQAHLEGLMEFTQTDNFGLLTEKQVDVLKDYFQRMNERLQQEQALAQQAAAAQQLTGGSGGNGTGGPPPRPPPPGTTDPTRLGPGELQDETLPSARGVVQ